MFLVFDFNDILGKLMLIVFCVFCEEEVRVCVMDFMCFEFVGFLIIFLVVRCRLGFKFLIVVVIWLRRRCEKVKWI